MNTLVLFTEEKIGKALKERRIVNPFAADMLGGTAMTIIPQNTAAHDAGSPDHEDVVGAAFALAIKRNIVTFARACLRNEPKRPKPQDIVEMQVIFVFHQSQEREAGGIFRALDEIALYIDWSTVTNGQGYMLRVRNVWLLSCESAAHKATNRNPLLAKYVVRATAMERAASWGFVTEVKPPPSNPREYFPHPAVFTCTMGDPITGSLVLDPNHVMFAKTPDWGITRDGEIVPTGDPNLEEPCSGTIYKYEDGKYSAVSVPSAPLPTPGVPATGGVDILGDPGLTKQSWTPTP